MKVETGRKDTDGSIIYKDACDICKLDIGNQDHVSDGSEFVIHITCGVAKLLPQIKLELQG